MEANASSIEQLQARLKALQTKEEHKTSTDSVWTLLTDRTKDLTPDEWKAILGNPDVAKAQQEMVNAFLTVYLFDKFKNDFASLPNFRPLCENYVNSILSARQGLYGNTSKLKEENERLKAELEKYQGVRQWTTAK